VRKYLNYVIVAVALQALFFTNSLHGQGQIDTTGSNIYFKNETTVGLMLNSNGVSLSYRFARRVNLLKKNLLETEFSLVKHPKEESINSPLFPSNRSFVFGKKNNFFTLRIGIGRQVEIYSKADIGSIAIRILTTGGASIGMLKPYYYEKISVTGPGADEYTITTEKFNENIHNALDVYQRAPFFTGINELSIVPGAYLKTAVSFEYSRESHMLHIIEGGAMIEAFPKKIPIMALTNNNQFFLSIFVSYRFGHIVDPRLKALKKEQRRAQKRE
jgi:hypothetical protein